MEQLLKGQQICEYSGPRLPLEVVTHGDYVLEVPRTDTVIDGAHANCPLPPEAGTLMSVAIYANHRWVPHMEPHPGPSS